MTTRFAGWIAAAIVLATLVAGLVALSQTAPDQMVATHFSVDGRPNGWMPARFAYLVAPILGAVIWMIIALAPRLTPRGENLTKSGAAYGAIWILGALMGAFVQALILGGGRIGTLRPERAMPMAIGLIFVVFGNVMPKLRWNFVAGIRTPWTLADERVWDKTHRFAGWLMVLGGLCLLASAILPGARPGVALVVGVAAVVAVTPAVRSYFYWRERQSELKTLKG